MGPSHEKLSVKNPATGTLIQELNCTDPAILPHLFSSAKKVQALWANTPIKERVRLIRNLRELFIDRAESISKIISSENGKPEFEAYANEVFASIELMTYFANKAPDLLADQEIPMNLMKHRESYLHHWPLGVIAVITPWNYPLLMPIGELVMGVLAGNAVIFKPSEITPLIGIEIQKLFEDAGFPKGLVTTVIGDGKLGAAIIENRPAKIFFTGSVATGKRIMRAASEYLIPVNLELGGKDPMIVLSDADLDYATSAALWGAFSNSGQICASVERILVHNSIADSFNKLLAEKARTLRQGPADLGNHDLGAITFEKQKEIYDRHIQEAKARGAQFICGGEFSADRRFLRPTIVTGKNIEELEIYNEETFGPVVAITTFNTVEEAIEKANRSKYGLLASIITKDIPLAEMLAKRLECGTVTINEVVYTAGLPETPWGGVKDTGFGKKHSAQGLYEFVNTKHIHKPVHSWMTFKSPWWFPYTPHQRELFKALFELYRKSWVRKLIAIPTLLWNAIVFFRKEPRI